jgi:nucleoside-diphosphate-sugar epimerase
MRILITGASGFIGKNLLNYLSPRYEVIAPTRQELDLLDDQSVRRYLTLNTVDVIIHTAGKPGHRNAQDSTGVFYADCRMFYNLHRNRDSFGKLLITGSGAIYDMCHYLPKMKEEYSGTHMPADEHGFFRYVTSLCVGTDNRIIDLRIFGVFGKYEDYAIRFISNAICKTLFDLPITINQNRRFDYLYIDDLLPVMEYFFHNDARYNTYNVTPDNTVELYALAEMVRRRSGKDLPIIFAKPGLGLEYSGDNARLHEEIPELSFTPLELAIDRLYDWYEMNRSMIDRESLLIDK